MLATVIVVLVLCLAVVAMAYLRQAERARDAETLLVEMFFDRSLVLPDEYRQEIVRVLPEDAWKHVQREQEMLREVGRG